MSKKKVSCMCLNCSKSFEKIYTRWVGVKKHFCCRACYTAWRNRNSVKLMYSCDFCGDSFQMYPHRLKTNEHNFCSKECANRWMSKYQIKEKCVHWKGGRHKSSDGYIYINQSNKGARKLEHRLIMEEYLERKLKTSEIVHHINGIRDDNKIENLCVVDNTNHERGTLLKQCRHKIVDLENTVKGIYGCPN